MSRATLPWRSGKRCAAQSLGSNAAGYKDRTICQTLFLSTARRHFMPARTSRLVQYMLIVLLAI
jgi:hypothetical protein